MESSAKMVTKVNKLNGDIRDLLSVLLYFGHLDKGKQLQGVYSQVLADLSEGLAAVFPTREEQIARQEEMRKLNPDAVMERIFDRPFLETSPWKNPLFEVGQ